MFTFKTGEKAACSGCGTQTRGLLVDQDGQLESIPCCPRCRDTKSKFETLTGQARTAKNVSSDRSRATTINIPEEDQIPPMLARAFKEVKPDSLRDSIWASEGWYAGKKYDGVRVCGYIVPGSIYYLSRNKSKANGLYVDKSAVVPHLQVDIPALYGTVFDGELLFTGTTIDTGSVTTSSLLNATVALTNCDPIKSLKLQGIYGKLGMVVFDVMKFKAQDIRKQPLKNRLMARSVLVATLHQHSEFFMQEEAVYGGTEKKMAFYREIIASGGEGVMLKDLNSSYCLNASSRLNSWVKVKRRQSVDAFVTGFIPGEAGFKGLVGALIVSVNSPEGEMEIARVSNIELKERRRISTKTGDLIPEMYRTVVEISFQEITTKSERGRHATLDKHRPDKSAEECTLESMTLS